MGSFVSRRHLPNGWNEPWSGDVGVNWMRPDLNVHLARAREPARFVYMMIEDGSFVPDCSSTEYFLHHAHAVPKNDPMPPIGQATSRTGIVATVTISRKQGAVRDCYCTVRDLSRFR